MRLVLQKYFMTESSFYRALLKLNKDWDIDKVTIDAVSNKIHVHLKYLSSKGICPFSEEESEIYDFAPERNWRHLDTMQYQTWLVARVPRVINNAGKVSAVEVPWADYSERYTFLFSLAVIQLLQMSRNQTKTAEYFKTTFDVANSIMNKSVV